jgi:hypothetical protein
LRKTVSAAHIYFKIFLSVREVKIPEPGSPHDDGLTKDYTGNFPDQRQTVRQDIIPTVLNIETAVSPRS